MKAGVALFALASGNLRGEEMAQAFVRALPRMRQFLAKYHPPFIARVTRSGAVSMVLKSTELQNRYRTLWKELTKPTKAFLG